MKPLAVLFLLLGVLRLSNQEVHGRDRVSVQRKVVKQTQSGQREWKIDYDEQGIILSTSYGSLGLRVIIAAQPEVLSLQKGLKKFTEMAEFAKQNNVKSFEELLVILHADRLYFAVDDAGGPLLRGTHGFFAAADVVAFLDLLTALPELEIELTQSKAKRELLK